MKTNTGYTLIEIIMVLAIMMILAACTLPGLQAWLNRASDDVIKTQCYQLISFAQAESRIRHVPVGVCQSDNGHRCLETWSIGLLVFIDRHEDGTVEDKRQLIRFMPFRQQDGVMHSRAYPYYRHYFLFAPDGLLNNDNGTLWYCHRKAVAPAFALTLSKSGMMHFLEPDKRGVIYDTQGKVLGC